MEKPDGAESEKMNTNGVHHTDEEAESETSFGGNRPNILDRLGMVIDDKLHTIFQA